jgi:hypothetical protein
MSGPVRLKSPVSESPPDLALLDRVLFYLLLAVLCARPMLAETFESGQVSFLSALQAEGGPTSATTAWLDSLLLAASVVTLLRRRPWPRRVLSTLAIGLLAVAVVISSLAAGDKPLALLAGSSLVITVLAAAALVSLVQARWMRHLLVAALLATGCATAIKCVSQVVSENPQTLQQWEAVYKPQLLRQGYEADDPLIVNFERRMRSGEAYGFIPHPNITGSNLMVCLLVALGALAGLVATIRWPRTGPDVLLLLASALVCLLIAAALGLTRSRGALVSGALGLLLALVLGFAGRWVAGHARSVLTVLVGAYIAVIAGTAAYGVAKGTLPHSSLAFRWYYWTAAARAIQDAPLTGIGRDNFAAAYMRYKAPESPEEVRDPHDVWVSLLTELGPLGLVGGALLCATCLLGALRALAPPAEATPAPDVLTTHHAWPAALAVLLVHAACSAPALADSAGVLIWSQDILLAWILPFAAAIWLFGNFGTNPRSAAWLTAGCCAALLAALVHGLIDFALLTPGGLAIFVLCAAAALGTGQPFAPASAAGARRTWARAVPFAVGGALIAAHLLAVVRPTTRATWMLHDLDLALRTPPPEGPAAILRTVSDYTARHGGDATARTAIRTLLQVARSPAILDSQRLDWLTLAKVRAEATCQANPRDTSNFTLLASAEDDLAQFYARAGNTSKLLESERDAAQSWQHAVALYPTNPRTRISAGRAWFELWQADGDDAAARRARENFEQALWIDDRRPPEEVVRLRLRERLPVEQYLRQLPPASAPATTAPGS